MKISQIKVAATIPTAQYANIQPEITVDLTAKDDIEKAKRLAFEHIENISNQYAEDGKALTKGAVSSVEREMVKCFLTGNKLYFDPISHTYINSKDELFISGSTFAEQFVPEFNKALILPKSAAKLGVQEEVVDEYWRSKADNSTTFGTALHQALEHYGRYKQLCEEDIDSRTGESKGYGIHPTLLPIVESFFEGRDGEQAVYEPFVCDTRNQRCGRIDRLLITGPKTCIIEDFKTNGDLYKKGIPANLKAPYSFLPNVPASKYILQQSFYKAIVEAAGWTVQGIRLHHWAGTEWESIDLKPVDIDVPQQSIDITQVV